MSNKNARRIWQKSMHPFTFWGIGTGYRDGKSAGMHPFWEPAFNHHANFMPFIRKRIYGGSIGSPYLLNQKCYRPDSMIVDLDETCLVINNTKFVKKMTKISQKNIGIWSVKKIKCFDF
jgi:hypothetical protein